MRAAGGQVVALSADADVDVQGLVDRLGLTFPVLSDEALAIAEQYGVRQEGKLSALPATFVLDPEHRIVFAKVGTTPTDRPTLDAVLAALAP